ncbi:MAG: hypothetical protein C0507_07540 [Cyanobacteria bacterium PR.3.49]|nr:hypothetical protein [Cyanobacteria bacterium PR.3.49]
MPISLTSEQVLALAPDASSVKSGKDLASVRKWGNLGCNEDSAWGECQGSGALPYQVRIDLAELAFKCTCPSRKFPCKHSIALLLMLVEQNSAFGQNSPPAWVIEWLEGRRNRAEKKAKREDEDKPVDAVAQAKRQEQRKNKVASGVAELDRWLQDILRQGLAGLKAKPFSFWESMAARLVDCQAPGLARLIRDCAGVASSGEGWQHKLMDKLGTIYLIVEAYNRFESLDESMQEEIKSVIGFTTNQDELMKTVGIKDKWEIVGQKVEREDKLRVQRTWLFGRNTKRWALILNFAHGTGMLDTSLVPGHLLEAELVFFPGSFPIRALVRERHEQCASIDAFTAVSTEEALQNYARALASNPWIERFPLSIENVVPVRHANRWWLLDHNEHALKMTVDNSLGWQLITLSRGEPINVFGEWSDNEMRPLTVKTEAQLVSL